MFIFFVHLQKASLSEMVDDLEEVEMTLRAKVKALESSESMLRERNAELEREIEELSAKMSKIENNNEVC